MTAGVPRLALPLVETPTIGGYEGPDLTWYLLTCILVIVGICGLGFVLRRFLARTIKARAARRSLQVVDVLPLGGKQKLVVVRCYDRSFLLGLGDKEVRSIAELDAEETLAPVAAPMPEIETVHPVRDPAAFARLLRRSAATPAPAPTARPAEPARKPVLEGGRGVLG